MATGLTPPRRQWHDSWPDVFTVGTNTVGSSAGVAVSDHVDGTDIITLAVPRAIDTRKFARLKVVIIEKSPGESTSDP
jgi:hypothetical protein